MQRFTMLAILALLLCPLTAGNADAGGDSSRSYLLIATGDDLPGGLAAKVKSAGGTLVRTMPDIGVAVAESAGSDFVKKARKIKGMKSVVGNFWVPRPGVADSLKMAKTDAPAAGTNDPTDPFYPDQWGLIAIDAQGAWGEGAKGDGVTVAVLDDGFSASHPDLKPNLLASLGKSFAYDSNGDLEDWDCDSDPTGPGYWFSHGSHVSGIIAAPENDYGIVGVAPEAKILPVQVLSREIGYGLWDWMIDGIIYATDNGADVINMSLSGYVLRSGYYDEYEQKQYTAREVAEALVAIRRALTYAKNEGVVVVAALGNEEIDLGKDKNGLSAPAELGHCIAVSATGPLGWFSDPTTDLDVPAIYTNYGKGAVDFAAPGGNVDLDFPPGWGYDMILSLGRYDSTVPDNWNYWFAAGTSMASPHVCGVAALVIGDSGTTLTPKQVESIMKKTADDLGKPGRDKWYGHGRVNAYEAVK